MEEQKSRAVRKAKGKAETSDDQIFTRYKREISATMEEVPVGINPKLYYEERKILDGGALPKDPDPLLFPAHQYGKGSIPNPVKSDLQKVPTMSLVKKEAFVAGGIPDTVFSLRTKLKKKTAKPDLESIMKDERLRGHRYLYHGLSSWGYVVPLLMRGMTPNFSLKNEFGIGVYLTDSLSLAQDYAGIRNGSILVFDWSGDKGLLTKTISGEEWEKTVKGWICLEVESKPPPPEHPVDMLIGAVTGNYDAILHCNKPQPSEDMQYVAMTDRAYRVLNANLVAIIYLE